MSKRDNIHATFDWPTMIYYLLLVVMGWISIYGASFEIDYEGSILSFDQRAGKQFVWIITALVLGGAVLLIDFRIFNYFAYIIYGVVLILLIVTIFIAPDIKGSRSWLVIGPVSFQPAELAKMATALALAKFMSHHNFKLKGWKDMLPLIMLIFIPFAFILLQKETGSALVFLAFLFMFYREGMNGIVLLLGALAIVLFIIVIRFSIETIGIDQGSWGIIAALALVQVLQIVVPLRSTAHKRESIIIAAASLLVIIVSLILNHWWILNFNYIAGGTVAITALFWLVSGLLRRYSALTTISTIALGSILFIFASDIIFNRVLEPHHQIRIKVLLNMEEDLTGAGYNVNQSKIAIGSGGFWGKGFLNGTQTKLKYVPEQDTDFIFCTVGEEHGFWGSTLVLIIYWLLLMRILTIAERQRETFHRVYAYSVVSILFFHLMINVGMVLGLMPVIGIPLPFFSYGGSSLWGFTLLLFILLRLDASRLERGR
ncbi:MAG: rod shape-determining protein RodA [Paludibacter sp.]|jgi:rod shape determining protein RodA|nr:rod shape-determining protein RodA [Paludibacter sp.]